MKGTACFLTGCLAQLLLAVPAGKSAFLVLADDGTTTATAGVEMIAYGSFGPGLNRATTAKAIKDHVIQLTDILRARDDAERSACAGSSICPAAHLQTLGLRKDASALLPPRACACVLTLRASDYAGAVHVC